MKLIDADVLMENIDVDLTVDGIENAAAVAWQLNRIMNTIKAAPAAEGARVVIPCESCRHWGSGTKDGFGEFRKCALDGAWHGPEFFCASGERNAGATES